MDARVRNSTGSAAATGASARPGAGERTSASEPAGASERAGSSAAGGLTIQRTFAAPRELVFRAWTEPQFLMRWSCPRGFTFLEYSRELRVGGSFFGRVRSPQGTEHRLRGVYREIVPPERLVFTHCCWVDADGDPGPDTTVTVTLRERGGHTEMTFHQGNFESHNARDAHAEGWTSCFERLAELTTALRHDAGH